MIDDDMLDRPFIEPDCEVIEAEEEEGELKTPTFGHVFGYPANAPGLTMIGMYAGVPFILTLMLFLIPLSLYPFRMGLFFIGLIIKGIVGLSVLLYLTNCIRTVADGQLHPPTVFAVSEDDTFWGLLRQFLLILAAGIICFAPLVIYTFSVVYRHLPLDDTFGVFLGLPGTIVLTFWGMFLLGIFFFPMCLLSIVMFDNLGALNPIVIIGSIFSTFFSYLLVVLLFFVPIALLMFTSALKGMTWNLLLLLLLRGIGGYLLMMDAYILGWFFYKNEEKLCWDV